MKRVCTTMAVIAISLAPLRGDVTLTQTITVEGALAAAMGGQQPKIVIRVKGNKGRNDTDVMNSSTSAITDLDTKQLIFLDTINKTAQVIPLSAPAAEKPGTGATVPGVDVQFKATGNKRTVEVGTCDDYSFVTSMDMAQFAGNAQMPQAAEMMKGVTIVANGVTCIAKEGKGVAEYTAFWKAVLNAGVISAALGLSPADGKGGGGMEKLMSAISGAPGLPYVTDITLTAEGTGPMVEVIKQMGPLKITQKTTTVSTDALGDDVFKIPADYKITEKK